MRMLHPVETYAPNGGRPIRFFVTPELMPDALTRAQLDNLAQTPGLSHHVAVLPDIHRKQRNMSPTGTVVVTKDVLVPHAVDTGINCGMRMIRTDLDASVFSAVVLDALFGLLMRLVPVLEHEHPVLTKEDVADIFCSGAAWCQRAFDVSAAELACIEDGATAPTDTDDAEAIVQSMPRKTMNKGRRRFATLGGGNHFLELQEIVEVLDHDTARRLGLYAGKALFMLHTCARGVGSKMMQAYLERLAPQWATAPTPARPMPLWSVPAASQEGVSLARALAAASNFGYANRMAITEQVRTAVRQVLHDASLRLPLLYDCAHVSIKPEQWQGEQLWVHRHGASRALPPSHCVDHPVFASTGQPVPIPGSMGHDSYIGVATETTAETFWSVNHGAGRMLDKPDAVARFTSTQVEQHLRAKNIRLYHYGTDNIVEQAPSSFKDISQVIKAMTAFSLAKPVVRLRPLAVLKG